MQKHLVHYRSNRHVIFSCKYHVIWCPKYRRNVLVHEVDTRLKEIIHLLCNETHAILIEMEIIPNHVHLLVKVDLQFGIHQFIKKVSQ